MFQLKSKFKPAGDQPKAIKELLKGFTDNKNIQTLLGATGTGKTFTVANVIQKTQKPTLLISHNKTLAAQLATELKHFFPNNAVHYFVSYFDYYQPESYLPTQGLYIEKEATINQEIELYRLATMASLLSREDVIVVASVSSLYGLGEKEFFLNNMLQLKVGQNYDFKELKRQLLKIQYHPVQSKIEHGMFDIKGEIIEIYPSTEKFVYKCIFNENTLEQIEVRDFSTFKLKSSLDHGAITIWPATQFLQDTNDMEAILTKIDKEKNLRYKEMKKKGMLVEAERIKKRVEYDIRMIRETGFTNGIENYSLYFDGRSHGEPPTTLFDYFPKDMLMVVDESHMTIPQFKAMPKADKSRKNNLIEHGFRLPSAIDHRPINFDELQTMLSWNAKSGGNDTTLIEKKKDSKTIFLSATPAEYELNISDQIVEQIIRPTGLLDPITYIYPKSGDYTNLEKSLDLLLQKKPHLHEFMDGYSLDDGVEEVFGE